MKAFTLPRLRLSWILLAGTVWLLYKCFSREILRVSISHPERDTTWRYEVFRYANFDLNYYMLAEGELDDTAYLYTENLRHIEEKRDGKPDSQYVVKDGFKVILPKGKFKIHSGGDYSTPITYRYVPYKARKGHVQLTFSKGFFVKDSTWKTAVGMEEIW